MKVLSFNRSAERIEQYSDRIAGGVNSHFRLGMAPGSLVIERRDGAYPFSVDGSEIIDYCGGVGAMVLGHGPQVVRDAVKQQVTGFPLMFHVGFGRNEPGKIIGIC